MKRYILVHYGEIALKKANKPFFVEKLRKALKYRLKQRFHVSFSAKHTLGRFMIELPDNFDEERYADVIGKISGIQNYKFVFLGPIDIKKLSEQIWQNMPSYVLDELTAPKNFKVSVKRSMVMPLKSFEMARDIGAALIERGLSVPVKLNNPEFVVDVEFFNNGAYFSYKKYPGIGGFPPNSQSKLVALISSGIDSPVAAYKMMKKGARIIFVHFHGYPYTDQDEMDQVRDLVKILSAYQFDTKLYLVPFGQVQRAIATNLQVPGKLRTVLYRRIMLKIAEQIARDEKAKGLLTGDSFGQVASQTPHNIFAIHDASTIPLFQPLISLDKEEIIKIAEKIGTFEISKLPCKDTCTMFTPKKAEIKANLRDVRNYEKNLPVHEWIEKVLDEAEIINFN